MCLAAEVVGLACQVFGHPAWLPWLALWPACPVVAVAAAAAVVAGWRTLLSSA